MSRKSKMRHPTISKRLRALLQSGRDAPAGKKGRGTPSREKGRANKGVRYWPVA